MELRREKENLPAVIGNGRVYSLASLEPCDTKQIVLLRTHMGAIQPAIKALQDVLTELRVQRDTVTIQIDALENAAKRLGGSPAKKRGRPKGSKNKPVAQFPAESEPTKKKGRRSWTPAQKEIQAERMRAAWKERRAGKAAGKE